MVESRSVLEGLASAFVSSDLTVREDRRGDVDYIVALGAAGTRLRPGASSVVSLTLSGDKASAREALRATLAIVRHLNGKRGWKLDIKTMQAVTREALKHHIAPTCPVCQGRKFKLIEGSPALSASPCATCHGTGKRPLPLRHGRLIAEVVAILEDTGRVIEAAVRRRLR